MIGITHPGNMTVASVCCLETRCHRITICIVAWRVYLRQEQAQKLQGHCGHIGLGCWQQWGIKDPLGVASQVVLYLLAYHRRVRLLTHTLYLHHHKQVAAASTQNQLQVRHFKTV